MSLARSCSVCEPSERAGEIVSGVEALTQPPPSRLTSYVAGVSVEAKTKVGVVSLLGSAGVDVKDEFGAVVSIVQV